eukprot:gnl/Chilomastix_cuspidata/5750.p1 GENE.gnl/Chilomastix_cuspidata/5750~~gnl/Chilomastix_cuspidata/5750.p1  ORF type:complete len:1448 (-),score=173.69 gnl/Chilomastix_cuspidata/5750:58-3939(-)
MVTTCSFDGEIRGWNAHSGDELFFCNTKTKNIIDFAVTRKRGEERIQIFLLQKSMHIHAFEMSQDGHLRLLMSFKHTSSEGSSIGASRLCSIPDTWIDSRNECYRGGFPMALAGLSDGTVEAYRTFPVQAAGDFSAFSLNTIPEATALLKDKFRSSVLKLGKSGSTSTLLRPMDSLSTDRLSTLHVSQLGGMLFDGHHTLWTWATSYREVRGFFIPQNIPRDLTPSELSQCFEFSKRIVDKRPMSVLGLVCEPSPVLVTADARGGFSLWKDETALGVLPGSMPTRPAPGVQRGLPEPTNHHAAIQVHPIYLDTSFLSQYKGKPFEDTIEALRSSLGILKESSPNFERSVDRLEGVMGHNARSINHAFKKFNEFAKSINVEATRIQKKIESEHFDRQLSQKSFDGRKGKEATNATGDTVCKGMQNLTRQLSVMKEGIMSMAFQLEATLKDQQQALVKQRSEFLSNMYAFCSAGDDSLQSLCTTHAAITSEENINEMCKNLTNELNELRRADSERDFMQKEDMRYRLQTSHYLLSRLSELSALVQRLEQESRDSASKIEELLRTLHNKETQIQDWKEKFESTTELAGQRLDEFQCHTAQLQQEIADLTAAKQEIETQLRTARGANESLEQQFQCEKTEKQRIEDEFAQFREHYEGLLAATKSENQQFQDETLESLNRQLAALTERLKEKDRALAASAAQLENERRATEASKEETRQERERVVALQSNLIKKETEIANMSAELKKLLKKIRKLEIEVRKLEETTQSQQTRLKEASKSLKIAKAYSADLEKQLRASNERAKSLEKELQKSQKELLVTQDLLSRSERSRDDVILERDELRHIEKRLKAAEITLQKSLFEEQERSQKLSVQCEQERARRIQAQAEEKRTKKLLKVATRRTDSLSASLSALTKAAQEKEDELNTLQRELQSEQTNSKGLRRALLSSEKEFEAACAERSIIRQELAEARAEVIRLRTSLVEEQYGAQQLRSELTQEREFLASVREERDELTDFYSKQIGSLTDELAQAQAEAQGALAALAKKEKRAEFLYSRVETLQADVSQQRAENEKFAEKLDELAEASRDSLTLAEECRELRHALQASTKRANSAMALHRETEQKYMSTLDELARTEAKLSATTSKLESEERARQQLQDTSDAIAAQLTSGQHDHTQKLDALQELLKAQEESLIQRDEDLKKRDTEITRLLTEAASAKELAENSCREKEVVEQELSRIQTQAKVAQTDLSDLRAKYESLSQNHVHIMSENDALTQKITELNLLRDFYEKGDFGSSSDEPSMSLSGSSL